MTPTLIDQLKLAIQVESGEVPLSEVEHLYTADGNNNEWTRTKVPPITWNYESFKYRRKPKPLECEVVVVDGRIFGIRGTIHEGTDCKIVKMREVIE